MDEAVSLVQRRHEVLCALLDEPLSKPAIVDATPYARSTVDRAIRELADADLVERDGACYRPTATGARMLDAYESFREAAGLYYDAREVVADVPVEEALPPELLDGATIRTACPEAPTAPVVRELERFDGLDSLQTACPRLLDVYDRHVHRLVTECGVEIDAVFPPSVIEAIETDYPERWQTIVDTGLVRASVLEDVPSYDLSLLHGIESARNGTEVSVTVYAEEGMHVIVTDAPDAVEWARRTWESLIADAEQVYPAAH